MDRQFPPLMLADMNHPAVKQAWVSDYPHVHPSDCYNCGGAGHVTLQVALAGPFRSPVTTSELNCKSEVLNGELKWWGVKTTAYECPVCHGGNFVPEEPIKGREKVNNPAIVELAREFDGKNFPKEDAWKDRKDLE
jgi:hypothetical protein